MVSIGRVVKKNLHVMGGLFFLGGVLRGNWRLGDIMSHFLGYICFLFSNLRPLCLLGRAVD